ncbi:MAG: hypothetical protein DU489_05170 [Nitrosomonas sp.]|uniref:hypothetical protein n=1 Tax=Nitrosomonas sp. TaxID=42353 RepID=UPI0032EE7F4A
MNMKSKTLSAALIAIFVPVTMSGCATTEQNQQLGGAVTGALIGGLVTGLTTGNVGAGLAAAAAGAAVGWGTVRLVQHESKQVRSAEEDQRLYGFAPATDQVMIRLNKGQASPNMISAGGQTTIYSDYSLSVPSSHNNQAEVTYTWKLKKDGNVLTESKPMSQIKTAAGHQTIQPISVPQNAEPGTYVVETILASGSVYDVNETVFVVK